MSEPFTLSSPKTKTARTRRGGWSWGEVKDAKLRTLSLGGGIQSTTLALMAAHGEIGPMPDLALYAPVGDARATREHIKWLGSANVLPFPLVELDDPDVTLRQNIQKKSYPDGTRTVSVPFFLDGKKAGQDRRQCTREYKVDRLNRAQREMMGYKPRQRIPEKSAEVWIGFSVDEVVRAGAAYERWAINRFPLLEQRMNLGDCIAWLERHKYPVPPRSKCTFCPYRTDAEWIWLRENEPEAWADAIEIDQMIRKTPGVRADSYLHRKMVPLAEVDLDKNDEDQLTLNICDGGCGV